MMHQRMSFFPPDRTNLAITLILVAAAIVLFFYYACMLPMLPVPSFYSVLAKAFLSGHTYLDIKPSPELLALADPYERSAHEPYSLWDASLYNGRYYLYFGPVPALIWIAVYCTTGLALTDIALVVGFSCVGTFCLCWLMLSVAKFEKLTSRAGTAFVMISLCFGTGLPFMVRRSSFYETAVSGAYCFSALGLLLLWWALNSASKRHRLLVLASLCFGLAVGCRLLHVFNGVLLLAGCLALTRKEQKLPLFSIFCLITPWVACIAGLMTYNYVRFGSVFESGMHYQLTLINVHKPDFHMFALKNFLSNAYFYLFRPLEWKTDFHFPFYHITYFERIPLPFLHMEAETWESVYGLFVNSTFSLWILVPVYFLRNRQPMHKTTSLLVDGIAFYGVVLLSLLLFYYFTTARYSVDFTPWLMVIAGIHYMRILSSVKNPKVKYVLYAGGAVTALYGAFAGIMSGYCGQYLCEHVVTQ